MTFVVDAEIFGHNKKEREKGREGAREGGREGGRRQSLNSLLVEGRAHGESLGLRKINGMMSSWCPSKEVQTVRSSPPPTCWEGLAIDEEVRPLPREHGAGG